MELVRPVAAPQQLLETQSAPQELIRPVWGWWQRFRRARTSAAVCESLHSCSYPRCAEYPGSHVNVRYVLTVQTQLGCLVRYCLRHRMPVDENA